MSDTPSARALVLRLQNAAFATGEDNQIENASNTRLNRNDAKCREAEKAVIDRIEQLEAELTAAQSSILELEAGSRQLVKNIEASERELAAMKANYEAFQSEVLTNITASKSRIVDLEAELLRERKSSCGIINGLRDELASAKAKLDHVHAMGLRFGMMKSSDKPEPYLVHEWTPDSDYERMFRDWSHSIGWEEKLADLKRENEWHPVSDHSGRGNNVLVTDGTNVMETHWFNSVEELKNVTHWRELPAPPQEVKP